LDRSDRRGDRSTVTGVVGIAEVLKVWEIVVECLEDVSMAGLTSSRSDARAKVKASIRRPFKPFDNAV
jgi:hypothetical protein